MDSPDVGLTGGQQPPFSRHPTCWSIARRNFQHRLLNLLHLLPFGLQFSLQKLSLSIHNTGRDNLFQLLLLGQFSLEHSLELVDFAPGLIDQQLIGASTAEIRL